MVLAVRTSDGQHRLVGHWPDLELANEFLDHLRVRAFSPATCRAYAFDLLNFGRFLQEHELGAVSAMDVFIWIDWQSQPAPSTAKVVALRARTVAPSTINRRVAAIRGLFEFLVMRQMITANPVPAPRRSAGLRPAPRGLLGHLGEGRRRSGGRLIRQDNRLPESLPPADVAVFVSDTKRQRIADDKMRVDVAVAPDHPIGYFSSVKTISFALPEGTRPADFEIYVGFDRGPAG